MAFQTPPPPAAEPTDGFPWRTEFRRLCRLAAPIVATQVAWVAMLTTDTAMIGRLGAEPLAGASFSLMAFFIGYMFCFGVTMSTAGLAAQAYGARRPRIVRRVIRQGLWVTILTTLPFVAAFSQVETLLVWTGQPPETLPHAAAYMSTLMWSLPMGVAFAVLRNFVAAVDRPQAALWVMAAGVPVNALLDYALIFGNFGLPRLELVGAGIATTTVNVLMVLALAALIQWRRPFNKYQVFARFWRPDWQIFRRIFAVGMPIAVMTVLEGGFFISAIFVIGQFGAVAVAAHIIALQMPHLTFMIPMGMSQAATVRVGQMAGRRDAVGAYRAGWTAVAVTTAFMAVMTVVIVFITGPFSRIFMDVDTPDADQVLPLAQSLLLLAALFQLGDGVQAVAAGALRGVNDTKVPMLNAVVTFWGLGAAVSLGLGFPGGMETQGVWVGFVVSLTVVALLQAWRLRSLQRKAYLPDLVGD
ncbi:MAG: MATE family efflux transporter [Rhodospirillaceae bacterium]|nr:MATE family efflux transporter [Rhodospirillaceae bacterium]